VLSVRGRLLKDRALRASGAERQRYYREAAAAYARAGAIGGATYPLINAATLSLLAGDNAQASTLARGVLDRAAHDRDEPETPYYRVATLAEAHLLLGDISRAQTEFTQAISLAPKAYEDHASTLRQFALILDAQGQDKSWLDSLRPPRCLHFAGHMAPADGGTIRRRIRAVLKEEHIGFGFGALAAGADILIAEALLETNAELHLVLPAPIAAFREASVARFGGGWATRFDEIVAAADSIRAVARESEPLAPLALQLAAEVAIGRSILQANTLMTEAVQLLIVERNPPVVLAPGGSGWIGSIWQRGGRRQRVLTAPRAGSAITHPFGSGASPYSLVAALRIELGGIEADRLTTEVLPLMARALSAGPDALVGPRWMDEAVLVGFEAPAPATVAVLEIAAALELVTEIRIAGHYAIVRRTRDPFGGEPFLLGSAMTLLRQIAVSTPPGAIHLTEDFAAALSAGPAVGRQRTEYVGELGSDRLEDTVRIFSLKR
jgi:hypothetical protein